MFNGLQSTLYHFSTIISVESENPLTSHSRRRFRRKSGLICIKVKCQCNLQKTKLQITNFTDRASTSVQRSQGIYLVHQYTFSKNSQTTVVLPTVPSHSRSLNSVLPCIAPRVTIFTTVTTSLLNYIIRSHPNILNSFWSMFLCNFSKCFIQVFQMSSHFLSGLHNIREK